MALIKPSSGVDDRVRLADAIPLRTPFTLNIFPTNLCNFRCSYCAHSLGPERLSSDFGVRAESMSLETLREVVRQARSFPDRLKLVSMMGHGEPLMNPLLPEMVKIVKEAGIAERIDVITNGSILDRARGAALIESGIDVIRISLQGVTTKKYREIAHVRLEYPKLIENISYLYAHRKQCKIYVKIMDISLAEGEDEQFYRTFDKISDRMYIDRVKPVYAGVKYDERVDEVTVDRYGYSHQTRKVCPQPFYMISVWPGGDTASCDAIYKAGLLGNIAGTTLTEMWSSDTLREFRAVQLRGLRYSNTACSRCCAPDDVIHLLDVLDGHEERISRAINGTARPDYALQLT
jgi:MoaA/NifB/PqqE/SkfB family radical SAM enzyme